MFIRSGTVLHELTTTRDAFPYSAVFWLAVFGCLSLIPVIFKKQIQKRMEGAPATPTHPHIDRVD